MVQAKNVVDRECKMRLTRLASFVLLAMVVVSTSARAATISYGNFGPIPPGITFQNVQESSGTDAVPLYGPPAPTPVGLDFDPVAFLASSTGPGSDITDGQLNFAVKTTNTNIGEISIFEGGDFSLTGLGGAQASVFAGLSMRLTITEIDNNPITPINVQPVTTASFSANSPPNTFGPWNLGVDKTLAAAIAGLPTPTIGITKVEVAIDNILTATSQANSTALIAKKEFQIAVNTDISRIVPEPTSIALAGLAMFGLFGRRRVA